MDIICGVASSHLTNFDWISCVDQLYKQMAMFREAWLFAEQVNHILVSTNERRLQ
jgi:hypothetical protein